MILDSVGTSIRDQKYEQHVLQYSYKPGQNGFLIRDKTNTHKKKILRAIIFRKKFVL